MKKVLCEACGIEYVYFLMRSATGGATGFLVANFGTALSKAGKKLDRILEKSCDPVPCPECGWYQRQMVRRVRQMKYRDMLVGIVFGLPLAAIFFVCGGLLSADNRPIGPLAPTTGIVLLILAGTCLVLGLGLAGFRVLLCNLYDPNAEDLESRKQLGQARAVSPEEISFTCSACGDTYAVSASLAGTHVLCRSCDQPSVVRGPPQIIGADERLPPSHNDSYPEGPPLFRDEPGQGTNPQAWVRRHDEYKD